MHATLQANWTGKGIAFDAIDPVGKVLHMDSSDDGFRPMQLLLMGYELIDEAQVVAAPAAE